MITGQGNGLCSYCGKVMAGLHNCKEGSVFTMQQRGMQTCNMDERTNEEKLRDTISTLKAQVKTQDAIINDAVRMVTSMVEGAEAGEHRSVVINEADYDALEQVFYTPPSEKES